LEDGKPSLRRLPAHQVREFAFLLVRFCWPRRGKEGGKESGPQLALNKSTQASRQANDDDLQQESRQGKDASGDEKCRDVPSEMDRAYAHCRMPGPRR
jgi:hypothetical protein